MAAAPSAGPDLNVLYQVIANPGVNDASIYAGYPQSRFRQDLNGDGSIGGPDANIMYPWLAGNYSNHPGTPDRLLLDGTTNLSVNIGDSVTLQAYALAPAAAGSALRTGLGVNFSIIGGTCTTNAQIYGYNVAGGATINTWRNPSAYHYLPTRLAPDNGRVWVKVRGNSCTDGQTTIIKVYIPSDAHSGASGQRFPSDLVAQLSPTNSTPVNFTITWGTCCGPVVSGLFLTPATATINEGNTVNFSATCILVDFSQVDCTTSFLGQTTAWTKTGTITQLSPPNLFMGNINGGIGHAIAQYKPLVGSTIQDSATVTVIDISPPDTYINSESPVLTNQTGATISFSCNESDCSYDCKLDSGSYDSCSSPVHLTSLAEGAHTFYVRAKDAANNIDSTPASYTWTIDLTPPETQITASPPSLSNSSTASFSFSCTDAHMPCTFSCSIDSGAFTSCTSPANYSGLSEASHTFQVQAIDAAGNPDLSPASYTWTIDLPPDTTITSHPYDPSDSGNPSFSFTCNKPPCTFECNLDSSGWSACSSPQTYGTDGLDTWTATSTVGAPSARTFLTGVWTGSEMIVWGGFPPPTNPDTNTGGRYNPVTDSWTATSTTNAPEARHGQLAVWTGTEMIVWGGWNASSYFNTGGRYNPATDSWSATSTTNAPAARRGHTAVWSGAEMIVWGGDDGSSNLNTGGGYNPTTDSWTATSITNAPEARRYHTAVWTGAEMILWGGYGNTQLNTGGRYNPVTDSWIPTSTTNALEGRAEHTAAWTGTEMIVWGGFNGTSTPNTGGQYNPATDSWIATSTTNAPEGGGWGPSSVWTGTEMIVWGGENYDDGNMIF